MSERADQESKGACDQTSISLSLRRADRSDDAHTRARQAQAPASDGGPSAREEQRPEQRLRDFDGETQAPRGLSRNDGR